MVQVLARSRATNPLLPGVEPPATSDEAIRIVDIKLLKYRAEFSGVLLGPGTATSTEQAKTGDESLFSASPSVDGPGAAEQSFHSPLSGDLDVVRKTPEPARDCHGPRDRRSMSSPARQSTHRSPAHAQGDDRVGIGYSSSRNNSAAPDGHSAGLPGAMPSSLHWWHHRGRQHRRSQTHGTARPGCSNRKTAGRRQRSISEFCRGVMALENNRNGRICALPRDHRQPLSMPEHDTSYGRR